MTVINKALHGIPDRVSARLDKKSNEKKYLATNKMLSISRKKTCDMIKLSLLKQC